MSEAKEEAAGGESGFDAVPFRSGYQAAAAREQAADGAATAEAGGSEKAGPEVGGDAATDSAGDELPERADEARLSADNSPASEPRRPRRRRRVALFGLRGLALIILAPLVFVLLLPVLMIGQEITAPSWIKARVEAQAAAVLGGGTLTFGEITVEVGRDLHPVIRVREAVLQDAAGSLLARVPVIEGGVSPRGLILRREVLPQNIRLVGAEIALRRGADGRVAVAFDGQGRESGEAESLPALIQSFDRVFERPALEALETLTVANLVLNYQDDRSGRAWLVDGGQLALDLTGDRTALSADLAVLSGRAYATTVRVDYLSPRGSAEVQLSVEVTDVAARDIATQSPALAWLGVLQGRMSARLQGGTLADGRLAPLSAEIEIGAGVLRPAAAADGVPFDRLSAALDFDPDRGRIAFSRFDIESEAGAMTARGHAYLRDMTDGLPRSLLGQFEVAELTLDQGALTPVPVALADIFADFRLTLDPFSIDFAQFVLRDGPAEDAARMTGAARFAAGAEGWQIALDARIDRIDQARLMALWPETVRPRNREWFAQYYTEGTHLDLTFGLRREPGDPSVWALSESFDGVTVQPMRTLPPIEGAAGTIQMQGNALVLRLDAGSMPMPEGGAVALAGSVFTIPDITVRQAPATITLDTASTLTAALSVLDQPPFGFLTRAGLPVTLGQGRVEIDGEVALPLMRRMPREAVDYAFGATVSGLTTDRLVPGRRLTAEQVQVDVSETELRISGAVRLDGVPATGSYTQAIGPGAQPGSRVDATVRIDAGFFEAFDIALPPRLVTGTGEGRLVMTLGRGRPAEFRLTSDLRGLSMSLPAIGWSKGPGTRGTFVIAGRLGAVPQIDSISLTAPGLEAAGTIRFRSGGGLEVISLPDVRVGGWLSASVDLVGQGAGRPLDIRVNGGALDLRRAAFGQGGGAGETGTIRVALDRLDVADGISIRNFTGTFDGNGGFNGRFNGLLNGTARIEGVVAPIGGRLGVRVLSGDAGAVLAAAGLLRTASGGTLDLTLTPTGGAGTYDGVVAMTDLRVVEAPALARLLDAISVVGLLQQLGGQGLLFTNVDVNFRLQPERITVTQASAVGPGLGISADGYYQQAARRLDFQGVVSPIYLLNGVGSILTRPGEGLFGFNFTVTGPVDDASVSVNPLSVLTPGMFREIFRRPVPQVE